MHTEDGGEGIFADSFAVLDGFQYTFMGSDGVVGITREVFRHNKDHSFLRKAPTRNETRTNRRRFNLPSIPVKMYSVGRYTTEHAEVSGEAVCRYLV